MKKLKNELAELISVLDSGRQLFMDAADRGRFNMLGAFIAPAFRAFVLKQGRSSASDFTVEHNAHFDWLYKRDMPEVRRLYDLAVDSQWKSSDIPWSLNVDPSSPKVLLLPDEIHPASKLPL